MLDSTIDAAIDTVGHRDTAAVIAGLNAWLGRRWSGATVERLDTPGGSGASSELFYLEVSGIPGSEDAPRRAVLRLAPAWPVYPIVDIVQQARCMEAARRYSAAPVPRVFAVENSIYPGLDAPFILMERLEGASAPDFPSYVVAGWIHDLSAGEQAALWRHGIEVIAALHETDVREAGLQDAILPTHGSTALDRMLAYWRLFLAHVERCDEHPVLRMALEWLERNRPDKIDDAGFVWGDASLRNMLFDGLHPCALLDFEFAHVGLRCFDAAFYALMDHVMARGFANGAPRIAGFPGIHDTLDYYERVSGRAIPHRDYLLRMALTYMALSTTRVYQRLAAQGRLSVTEINSNPPLLILKAVSDGEPLPE